MAKISILAVAIAVTLSPVNSPAAPQPVVRPAFIPAESAAATATPAPTRHPGMSPLPPDNFDPKTFGTLTSETLPLENGQRIVMRVNGEPVTWDAMITQIRLSGASLYERFPGAEASIAAALSAPVRDSLILNALNREFAKKHSLVLQPQEISRRTASVISQADPALKAGLTRLTPDQITQLVTDKLTREKVTRFLGDRATSAIPTLAELTSFTESMKPTTSPIQVLRARHIVIRATPDMSEFNRNDARARAHEIWQKLVTGSRIPAANTPPAGPAISTTSPSLSNLSSTGEIPATGTAEISNTGSPDLSTTGTPEISDSDFASAARSFSQDRFTAYMGGDLGYFKAGTMYPEVNKALEPLTPGQVTPVIKTPVGYHIFQLTERHPDNLRLLYQAWKRQLAVQEWQLQAGREVKVEDYLEDK